MLLVALLVVAIKSCSSVWSELTFTAPPRLWRMAGQSTMSGTAGGLVQADLQHLSWTSASSSSSKNQASATTRRIFGLGTSEILVILAVGILFFGPETLKGVAKEAGKAAGDLKEVPKAFQEGMDAADEVEEEGASGNEKKTIDVTSTAKVAKEEKEEPKEKKESKEKK